MTLSKVPKFGLIHIKMYFFFEKVKVYAVKRRIHKLKRTTVGKTYNPSNGMQTSLPHTVLKSNKIKTSY